MSVWLSLWLTACAVNAPPTGWLRVDLPASSPGGLVTLPVDLTDAGRCWQPAVVPQPDQLAARVLPDQLAARVTPDLAAAVVPLQFDPAPDAPAGVVRGELTLLAPPAVRTVWVALSGGPAPARETAMAVAQKDGVLTIRGATYEVTHDPSKLAGLPSRIVLQPSGKVFAGYSLNDRVYQKEIGGYALRFDRQPQVSLAAHGPLRTVVEVRARYLNEAGAAPASRPSAVYRFAYRPGSPLVEVTAQIRQERRFDWAELHQLEIFFADDSFPGWVGGDPLTATTFEAKEATAVKNWAALRDGDSVIGLVGPGEARIYDGRGRYGTYLHGTWTAWSSTAATLRDVLYLSGAPGAVDEVAKLSQSPAWTLPARLTPAATLDVMERLTAAARARPAAVAPRVAWWVSRIGQRHGSLSARQTQLAALLAALPKLPRSSAELDRWYAAREKVTVLGSADLGVVLEAGQLTSLFDLGAGRELLGGRSPLWELELRQGTKTYAYGPGTWSERQGPPAVQTKAIPGGLQLLFAPQPVEWQRPDLGPAVELRLLLSGKRLGGTLQVRNDSAFAVSSLETAVVAVGALGDDHADDTFFFSRGAGELQRDPVGAGVDWETRYPSGWGSMQYEAVYDAAGGLYLAAEDPQACTKAPYAHGPEGTGTVRYGVRWPAPDLNVPGNDVGPLPWCLELFRGDWYDAAQIYRRWAARAAPWWVARTKTRPQRPATLSDTAVWICSGATPYEPDHTVRRSVEFAKFMGVPTAIHWYNWHTIPFDTNYPRYDPPKPRVPEGVAELQRAGVKVMPYINGRLWDQGLPDFETVARPWSCVDEQQVPYTETYGNGVKQAAMCPATAFWQQKQKQIVLWLQNEIGVDGVYMDQIAAASPHLCMNPQHGHPVGGGAWWCQGYWQMLAAIRREMRPGKYLTSECNSEPFMGYIDGYLTWHWQFARQVPAFSAVYGDQVVLFSRAYKQSPTMQLANRMKAAQSLVFGEQIGWLDTGVIQQESGPFLRDCARLRHGLGEWFPTAKMLRVPQVQGEVPQLTADWAWVDVWPVTLPALQTGAWRAADGRVAVILANFGEQPLSVKIQLDAADAGLGQRATARLRTVTGVTAAGVWNLAQPQPVSVAAQTVVAYELSSAR
ncbi:MAG: hypothetical protein IT204_03900 [Fimbriimonadaceae bacterium]|nr:hypothetical protein [Fimbriimonadaceae bacterium]